MRPNLFVIGAMKCGTTSLHQYLAHHPDVFMSEPKEPGFFVQELNWSKGLDWYLGLFAHSHGARVLGESSTHYTKLPSYRGVADRIRTFNPDARLVYLMRDPLQRIESHYWHNVRNLHREAERREFTEAVAQDPEYLAFSDYAMQLEPYLAAFPRDQIRVLTFEEMSADPQAAIAALCRWLRLAGEVPAAAFDRRWNARPPVIRKARGRGALNRFRHSQVWERMAPLVPSGVRRWATQFAERTASRDPAAIADGLAAIRPRVRERVAALSELLGREFPEWTTLHRPP
jgi:hypothetical protein